MNNETKLTAADLALYLGCEVYSEIPTSSGAVHVRKGRFVGIRPTEKRRINPLIVDVETESGGVIDMYFLPEQIKPIIRPLSDMTGEEAEEFVPLAAGSQISFFQRTLSSCPSNWIKWLIEFENGDMDHLVMNETGETWFESYFKHDAERRNWSNTVNQHKQTMWLIRHGFDLFGWISAGLAIDKTKIETP